MSLLEILKRNKKQIIQAEMAALLHDLDKLCPEFINNSEFHTNNWKDVRKEKQKRWQDLIGKDETIDIGDIDPACIDIEDKDVTINTDCFGRISCPFVEHHENHERYFSALAMLVHGGGSGADGIDSELDKNPEEKTGNQKGKVFHIDTPFGYPAREWSNELEKVLDIIKKTDFSNIDRAKLMEDLSPHFNNALGETRFPCNDVTLWAHSYSVATLTKALLAKVLIEYEAGGFTTEHPYLLPKRKKPKENDINPEHNPTDFTLLKITFDREWILGTAQKAGDIVGMVDRIETLQDQLQQYYENDLLVGNETYRDEHRQLFILPRLGTWQQNGRDVFPELHQEFKQVLYKILDEKIIRLLQEYDCHGFPYAIEFADSAVFVPILESDRILTRTRELLFNEAVCNQSAIAMLVIAKNNPAGERCEVCGLQTAANSKERICDTCYNRRHNKGLTEKRNIYYEHITSNLRSLIDYNEENKLLLLSISFDLFHLWNGDLFENVQYKNKKKEEIHKNTSPGRLFRSHETLRNFFKSFHRKLAGLYPNRIFPVTLSPVRLEFVVSAHGMDEVITLLYRQYEEQFGKVRMHLPLSVGCIVFYHKFPLYIALEAANRMRKHLRPQNRAFTIVQNKENICYSDLLLKLDWYGQSMMVNWTVPTCRSDGEKDSFYPYFNAGGNDMLVQQIEPDAELQAYEGGFDFLLLDSAVRRFAITPQGLKHHISGSRPAWPFSAWQNFHRLGLLLEKLEKSQISHIENLLVEKQMQWGEAWQMSDDVIKQFCISVVMSPNGFGKKKKDGRYLLLDDKSNGHDVPLDSDKTLLINAAANGLLLEAIDFFLHLQGLKLQTTTKTATHEKL